MDSWARHEQSAEGPSLPLPAHSGDVTPSSRYPLQDTFYNSLVCSHIVVTFVYVSLCILLKLVAQRGTKNNVGQGHIITWVACVMVGGGVALQTRHSFLSCNPKVLKDHPPMVELPFAQAFVYAFGSCTVSSSLHLYLMGVKEKTRKASRGGLSFWFLLICTVVSLCMTANAYFYMTNQLLALPAWSSYHWEVLWEMCVIGSVFPVYDGSNLYALCMWLYTGSLNFVEHHVMNAAWVGSVTIAAVLLFTVFDGHWLSMWFNPGLGMSVRAAVQLIPAFAFLLPHFLCIFRYLLAAPSKKETSGRAGGGILVPLHGEADPEKGVH